MHFAFIVLYLKGMGVLKEPDVFENICISLLNLTGDWQCIGNWEISLLGTKIPDHGSKGCAVGRCATQNHSPSWSQDVMNLPPAWLPERSTCSCHAEESRSEDVQQELGRLLIYEPLK